jgi:secondary thiamine-phosphate synthase enzyme
MIIFETLNVKTPKREVLIEITDKIRKLVRESKIKEGVCRIFVPHTTAGITINENADPGVMKDILNFLGYLIPKNSNFSHLEGNSDAHIKSTLTGTSLDVVIHNNSIMLGTWQGIMFSEYDGPRERKVYIQIEGQ